MFTRTKKRLALLVNAVLRLVGLKREQGLRVIGQWKDQWVLSDGSMLPVIAGGAIQTGKFVLKDATVIVNGTDLSNRVQQVTMDLPDDEVEATSMQEDFKEYLKGLSDGTITVTFFNDFNAGSVNAVLWPLKIADTTFQVQVRPFDAVSGPTNPEYFMTARLFNFTPLSGAVGEAATTDVTFRNAAQTGIAQKTT